MSLVIYTGIHAIAREPELHLPLGTLILTLDALKAESPAALLSSENRDESHQADESQQALLLESLCEETLNTLSSWLKKNSDAKATIVWPQPAAYIASQLAAGKKTDDVLDEWQQLGASILTLFRSHRRQLILVGAEPGGETPEIDGLNLVVVPVAEYSPIYTLAAKLLLDSSEELSQTAKRLSTSSVANYKNISGLHEQVSSVLLHHQQQVQQTGNLTHSLQQLEQQLEQQHNSAKNNEAKLKNEQTQQQVAAKQERDRLTKQCEALKQEKDQQLSSLQEENDMVIAELHRVQEILEKTQKARDERQRKQAEIQASVTKLKEDNTRLTDELKKQQTALDKAKEEISAEKDNRQQEQQAYQQTLTQHKNHLEQQKTIVSSIKEENDMVIAELHRVQELLESKLQERDALIKQCENLSHQHTIAVQQREGVLHQLDCRLAQLQQLNVDKKQQQADQEALKQRLERTQKKLNVLKAECQQALDERDAWIDWLKSHANRFITATYRHSRTYRKALRQQVALVNSSPYFDGSWYKEQYPDVDEAQHHPAEHYLKYGALEGRHPSPHFNTDFYIIQYPDVASAGHNPLLHFLRHGQMEQRKVNYEQLQLPSPQNSGWEIDEGRRQAPQSQRGN